MESKWSIHPNGLKAVIEDVQKDLGVIKSFFYSKSFYPTLRNRLLMSKEVEIVLLGKFSRENKDVYVAKGYAQVGKDLLPLEVYYRFDRKELTFFIGNVRAFMTLREVQGILLRERMRV